MNSANSFGGIVLAIAVAVVAASAVSRAQPDTPGANPDAATELLASELIGRPVRSPNGEAVGEIADLVLSPSGKVSAAVVSVGGFLGLGERRVEVPYDKLVVAADRTTVLVTLSKDQIAAIPEFSSGDDRRKQTTATAAPPGAHNAVPPPAVQPDAAARSEANAEAAESFATDDPRVAQGIAENKEAFDKDRQEALPQ